jgi:hypothetical protein
MRPVLDVRFDYPGITAYLKAMNPAQRQSAFRAAMRKVARPVVADLKKAWRNARRRKGRVSRDIARAQDARVRYFSRRSRSRGLPSGAVMVQVGTDYRKGGGAKLWHLLERGHRHYSRGAEVYRPNAIREMRARKQLWLRGAVGMDQTPGRSMKEKWHAAHQAWQRTGFAFQDRLDTAEYRRSRLVERARQGFNGDTFTRLQTRVIPGRFISMPVAERWRKLLARDAQRELFRELEAHARKVAMRRQANAYARQFRAEARARARMQGGRP